MRNSSCTFKTDMIFFPSRFFCIFVEISTRILSMVYRYAVWKVALQFCPFLYRLLCLFNLWLKIAVEYLEKKSFPSLERCQWGVTLERIPQVLWLIGLFSREKQTRVCEGGGTVVVLDPTAAPVKGATGLGQWASGSFLRRPAGGVHMDKTRAPTSGTC